jgi:anaerobic selenocysteine-containing dehydrogenase
MALAHEFEEGSRRILHLNQVNPLFSLPPALNFERVFTHAAFIVSFSSFLDESTSMADLILPDHSPLESWGDHIQHETNSVPSWNLSQPVVRHLYNTRAIGDVWLEVAHRLGGSLEEQLPWKTFQEMLRNRWETLLTGRRDPTDSTLPFETRWNQALQQGGWWPPQVQTRELTPDTSFVTYEAPQLLGNSSDFPFYCYPYPSLALHDGRGANLPWLQELPDPLTTGMWGTWIEINPSSARRLGIHQGDLIRVASDYGSIEAPAVYFPGLHPELVAIPIGQGHQAYGRYAKGRGANPLVLLGPNFDARSGSLATGGTRIRVERIKGRSQLPMLDQSGRNPALPRIQLTGGL